MEKHLALAIAAAVLWGILGMPTSVFGQYTFGGWARDHGYTPGDVMPGMLEADKSSIDSLDGIGEFDWVTSTTRILSLYSNQITSIESCTFIGLINLTRLDLDNNQITSLESGAFYGLTNLEGLYLDQNQITNIESGAFSGLTNLRELRLGYNPSLTELNLAESILLKLTLFDVRGNVNISSISLRNTIINQESLTTLIYGGNGIGIDSLPGITKLDLSGINFGNITHLSPLYVMDDLTDLWLVDTQNLDAFQLDLLLDNLDTIESPDIEGILYMTQADFDAFNTAGGGLLAA